MGTEFTKAGEEKFGTAIEGIDSRGAGKARIPGGWPKPLAGQRGKGSDRRAATAARGGAIIADPGSFSGNGNNIPGVPCQHAAPGARVRATVTLAIVAAFMAAASACMLTSGPAAGAAETAGSSSSQPAVSVVIDSVSPQVAKPDSTVTVSGTVTNTSHRSVPGVSVVLRSSASALASRDDLASYARGSLGADTPVGTPVAVTSALAAGVTAHWKLSLSVHSIGISQFGVYPLAVQAQDAAGLVVGIQRTFLPYWPGAKAADVSKPLRIAWIWPLINPPQQGICTALTSNSLATSVAPDGRLGTLLSVGSAYASRADLTWAVDPGLLSSVATMTRSYRVGASTDCAGGVSHDASTAAAQWLSGVKATAAGQPMFTTPYDDVDVAALTHQGLDSDLRTAYSQGGSAASALLGDSYQSTSIAWPADGLADSSVLGNLAVNGISTAVLASSEMPATGAPDDAVTSTPTPAGTTMKVLLADSTLTSVLGSATSAAGSAFAVSQEFLAETAMIEAEDPQAARSVVVAPPREWDPSPTLAGDLLDETTSTPWLTPDTLSGLAASAASSSQAQRLAPPDNQISASELTGTYLKQVGKLGTGLRSYKSILAQPRAQYLSQLSAGVAATESSAWRGSTVAQKAGTAMLDRVSGYLSQADRKVQIINSGRATLVGSSGSLPVSIQNGLPLAIQVRLQATESGDSRVTVKGYTPKGLITVGAGQTETVRVSVHSGGVGSTTMDLRLFGQDGRALSNRPVTLSVQSIQFGNTLLIIIFAALGVLVLTAIARAIRRGLRDTPGGPGDGTPGDGDDEAKRSPAMPFEAGGAATVETGNDAPESRYSPEAPDDHARARDWARYA
jgi:Family of unknown function (DUF6049)